MLKIPSAESLLLPFSDDILEDVLARLIIEANIHMLHSLTIRSNQFVNNQNLINILKEKGYDVTINKNNELYIKWD